MPYYYYWDWTYLLIIPGLILGLIAQAKVKSAYAQCSRIPAKCGLTASQMVADLLRRNGNTRVRVGHVSGELTDHYDPSKEVLNLSDGVYSSNSIAAMGIAAHEAGHAMQKLENCAPLNLRSAIVPAVNISSSLSTPMFILGLIFAWQPLVYIGIGLFGECKKIFFAGEGGVLYVLQFLRRASPLCDGQKCANSKCLAFDLLAASGLANCFV